MWVDLMTRPWQDDFSRDRGGRTMIRQGDVLLVPYDKKTLPKTAKPVARDNGRVVLAYGEVSGHAHAFTSPHVGLFRSMAFGQERNYLHVGETATLGHEEHDPIEVPKGTYRVVQQREFDSEMPRPAAD